MQERILHDHLDYTLRRHSARKEAQRLRLSREAVYQGELLLINAAHPLRTCGEPEAALTELASLAGVRVLDASIALETECAVKLEELLEAAGAKDDIVVVSGYRTAAEQAAIYEQSLQDNGPVYTASYVALPGRSEHQSGLAVDVGERTEGELDFIAPSFPDRGRCLTFKRLAALHGFIQRYQEGKEERTGIAPEPWHFRYVGAPHAAVIERLEFCLEEYIDYLKGFTFEGGMLLMDSGEGIAAYYVRAEEEGWTEIPLPVCSRYTISGNNADGFIVTAFGIHIDA
ncbi:D-alanyl-D-alanine carboxypeptidase family protein [Paenibacillus nanensis]|uniref:D-alanyl-D-alanine carboxypeptidase family protein n=1 Tax=Paenibacillus nanensis TaxID=393251 RepID=A0A3A1URX4_9BACL|nr:D-alanyl-D-alanine carboxypeptidase family protein [Paenibacillus nanensis]RIX51004.1 D-alanyl-D-alanine carboxypeptidase family protein [Paenibacillus nanensis]